GNHDAGSGRPVTTEADGTMRLYTGQHQFYAGIDLHARSLYAHVLDERGRTVLDRDLPASPDAFLAASNPARDALAAPAVCMSACRSSSVNDPSSSPTSRPPTASSTPRPSRRSSPTPATGPPTSPTASTTRAPGSASRPTWA